MLFYCISGNWHGLIANFWFKKESASVNCGKSIRKMAKKAAQICHFLFYDDLLSNRTVSFQHFLNYQTIPGNGKLNFWVKT